jgi:large subunit ribosomal protein L3
LFKNLIKNKDITMIEQIFATKKNMSQAWSADGKRLAITKCLVEDHVVINRKSVRVSRVDETGFKSGKECLIYDLGYGQKKIKNMAKPQRAILEKAKVEAGVRIIKGVRDYEESNLEIGSLIDVFNLIEVGDQVHVSGKSKGRGFAGVMKRHGFSGGPKTHGQSDRERAPGSIAGPGSRVWKGQRMAGHYGDENVMVRNLTIVHIDKDKKEIWLSGPVPGHFNSFLFLRKINKKSDLKLNFKASGIEVKEVEKPVEEKKEEKETK